MFGALLILSLYFIYTSYNTFIKTSEDNLLEWLHAISNTLSLQIDGDKLEYLMMAYP